MQSGKWNVLIDAFWGSSGKGKAAAWLADKYSVTLVSSSNFPNAGHTAEFRDGTKFVAKAIPTAAILKRTHGIGMKCFLSPGSGFTWPQLVKEWVQANRPYIFIHSRASIVNGEHAQREREGRESTKHIASTMQGSSAAMVDKILRKPECLLARTNSIQEVADQLIHTNPDVFIAPNNSLSIEATAQEFCDKVSVLKSSEFRNMVHSHIDQGQTWLHEGSQGYALSIDHGSQYPTCTFRNCTTQAAMDHMAIPPLLVGDVYLNLRTFPIRVGNVVEDGEQKGYSGDFYPDCKEMTWEEVAKFSGMPEDEAAKLAERERTTVTKRIRRVTNFSYLGLQDAVRANGATRLIINFIQYLDWKDAGLKGGREMLKKLSRRSRDFLAKVEEVANVPVAMIGTGPCHDDVIDLTFQT